jgi:hypothetical protein
MGGFLLIKLVKRTKVFCSWPPHQSGFGKILPSETKPDVRTAATGVLREANAGVGQELGGLDAADRVFHELAEFLTLLVGNRGSQVLHLDQPLANEYDLGNFGKLRQPTAVSASFTPIQRKGRNWAASVEERTDLLPEKRINSPRWTVLLEFVMPSPR